MIEHLYSNYLSQKIFIIYQDRDIINLKLSIKIYNIYLVIFYLSKHLSILLYIFFLKDQVNNHFSLDVFDKMNKIHY